MKKSLEGLYFRLLHRIKKSHEADENKFITLLLRSFLFLHTNSKNENKEKSPHADTRGEAKRNPKKKGKVVRWPGKFKMRGGSDGWFSILGHRNGTLSRFLTSDDILLIREKIMALMPISERNPISTPNPQLKSGSK